MNTRCTRARARPLEHDHEHSSTTTRWAGNQWETVSRILNDMRNPSDISSTCAWVCMGLDICTCSECLAVVLANFRDFNPPEHVPRTSARAHTCAVVFGRAPCVPRSREHERKDPRPEEKKIPMCKKNTFIHSNTRFAFGMWEVT